MVHHGSQSYTRYLLRESFRENGKVLANLTPCPPQEIDAIRLALRHKEDLSVLLPHPDGPTIATNSPASAARSMPRTASTERLQDCRSW
jgi:hypothetical protein